MAAILRQKYPFLAPSVTVDHLVVGAGVIGLAIGEKLLQSYHGKTIFVVERHGQAGQETSSRNSEVIHNGLYYPEDSLKTKLCIRGRDLLYKRCRERNIPHRKTGKLVLACSSAQLDYLKGLETKGKRIGVPLESLSGDRVRELEQDVGRGVVGGLLSPETGIVSSHALMEDLEKSIDDSESGELVYGTKVVRIDRAEGSKGGKRGDGSEDGWVVQTITGEERTAVLAKVVVNASGLSAHHLANQVLPEPQQRNQYFAKGNYFSYKGPGVSHVRHLLYPCPDPNSLAGLGTHLTMNLSGEIRFGPDVQWLQGDAMDFWEHELAVSERNLSRAVEAVQTFLPDVIPEGFAPDYAGIRPKISRQGDAAEDFSISHPLPGFISLLGIESPGLTSSLAIAEVVEAMIRKECWGLGRGKGRVVSEGGGSSLDAWA